ncbi:MAG: STAS domain-containing protein [Gammaproteobacteria bacterium]
MTQQTTEGKAVGNTPFAINLEANLNVGNSIALKEQLQTALRKPATLVLDAGAVQAVDTAGLQLLAAFVRRAEQAGMALEWREPTPALRAAATLLGLDAHLHLPKA